MNILVRVFYMIGTGLLTVIVCSIYLVLYIVELVWKILNYIFENSYEAIKDTRIESCRNVMRTLELFKTDQLKQKKK
jgi:hypothetical protein